jgi:hypothetical protein
MESSMVVVCNSVRPKGAQQLKSSQIIAAVHGHVYNLQAVHRWSGSNEDNVRTRAEGRKKTLFSQVLMHCSSAEEEALPGSKQTWTTLAASKSPPFGMVALPS